MAISFPTGLDNFTNPSSGNTLDSPSHSLQHSDLNDAVEALEAKLGVGASPAGSASAGQVLTISAAGTSAWTTLPTAGGLVPLVPGSVSVGAGSATVGTAGLVTFSSISTISINDVFSSTYRNYKMVLRISSGGAAGNFQMRLRSAGSDNSSNIYYSGFSYDRFTNTTGNGAGNPSTTYILPALTSTGTLFSFDMNILEPNIAIGTLISYKGVGQDSTSGYSMVGAGFHDISTAFTGMTLINSGGNIGNGTLMIYGFRN